MKLEAKANGRVAIDCQRCGRMYEVPDFRSNEFLTSGYESCRHCPECVAAEDADRRQRQHLEEAQREDRKRADLLQFSQLPLNYWRHRTKLTPLCDEPVFPEIFHWVWAHRGSSILLSGETGSGKSTAAGAAAYLLIRSESVRIRYTPLRQLLAGWKRAKTADDGDAPEKFLRELRQLDVLIVDEVVGKAKLTESGQELLFAMLESVNSGMCRARLWLLGNFYAGSIEELFSDPAPVRRRIAENFACALLTSGEARPLMVRQNG